MCVGVFLKLLKMKLYGYEEVPLECFVGKEVLATAQLDPSISSFQGLSKLKTSGFAFSQNSEEKMACRARIVEGCNAR